MLKVLQISCNVHEIFIAHVFAMTLKHIYFYESIFMANHFFYYHFSIWNYHVLNLQNAWKMIQN
jgi:hypothetical protein